jgi:hypothetical protein
MPKIAVLTISDRSFAGTQEDTSGAIAVELLRARLQGADIHAEIVPDEQPLIEQTLRRWVDDEGDYQRRHRHLPPRRHPAGHLERSHLPGARHCGGHAASISSENPHGRALPSGRGSQGPRTDNQSPRLPERRARMPGGDYAGPAPRPGTVGERRWAPCVILPRFQTGPLN